MRVVSHASREISIGSLVTERALWVRCCCARATRDSCWTAVTRTIQEAIVKIQLLHLVFEMQYLTKQKED